VAFVTVNEGIIAKGAAALKFEGTTLVVMGMMVENGALDGVALEFEGTTLVVMGLLRLLSDCA
jgi:hypothetical protein